MLSFPKKLLGLGIAVALTLVGSSSSFADCYDASSSCCSNFGSIYATLGLNYGVLYEKVPFDSRALFDPANLLFPNPISTSLLKNRGLGGGQLFGSFNLGYQTPTWCRLHLSLEAFVTGTPKIQSIADTADAKDSPFQVFKVKTSRDFFMTPTFGLALKPAFQIYPDVFIAGRFGYCVARAEFHRKSIGSGSVDFNGLSSTLNTYDETTHKYLRAIQTGLSYGIRLSDHFTLNMGYTWNHYNSITQSFRIVDPSNNQFAIRSSKVRPELESFTTSISYSFTPSEIYSRGDRASCGHEVYAGFVGDRDNTTIQDLYHTAIPKALSVQNPVVFFDTFLTNNSRVARGWGYEGFIGYGYTFTCGEYLGFEAFYNSSPTSYKDSSLAVIPAGFGSSAAARLTSPSTLEKLKDSYGVVFVPGYKLNDHILVYFKLGVAKRRLQFKETANAVPPLIPRGQKIFNRNTDIDIYGYQLGAGFDLRLCGNLYLRNEFVVTQFSSGKLRRNTSPLLSNGGFLVAIDRSFIAQSGQYKMGLVYKFPVGK